MSPKYDYHKLASPVTLSPAVDRAHPGSRTHRSRGRARGPISDSCKAFVGQAEDTVHSFAALSTDWVHDVFNTLTQVRREYDAVHNEAEQKEAQLRRLREDIQVADRIATQNQDELQQCQHQCQELETQYKATLAQIEDSQTSRKVYLHMSARLEREQAILKEKMLKMEQHLGRKAVESEQQKAIGERVKAERVQRSKAHASLVHDMAHEREACQRASEGMRTELQKIETLANEKRSFENWRRGVAQDAADEAFNASAGRLRKLYAIEKLAGNCLQKTTIEQLGRSQATEDGFQKIREVTGLADVMDIVHKFLNRDVEHRQLQTSVNDAEVMLEGLKAEFNKFKRETEGMAFDTDAIPELRSGAVYKEIEMNETMLSEAMEGHDICRARLQKTTIEVEHMKRWSAKIGTMLADFFPEPVRVDGPHDLKHFFKQLSVAAEVFVKDVEKQIKEHSINRKILREDAQREQGEHARLLANKEFLTRNCRVRTSADDRPIVSRKAHARTDGGDAGAADNDDQVVAFADERQRLKKDSEQLEREHAKMRHKS